MAVAELRDLSTSDVRDLLRAGPVRFVVANVGDPLREVPVNECFRFWKDEVKPRVADCPRVPLKEFPNGYCYFASEWGPVEGPPLVVLSVAH
jgi:hypothetical protein